VDISGELGITVLYKGEEENNPMEIAEGKLDFSGSVPFEGGENTVCKVSIDVENCRCTVAEDEDGENRVIDVEAVMNVQITADEEYSVEVLEDAYCINKKIDMEEEEIAYDLNVCNISSQYPIKEIIEIDEQSPDILRIFKVTGMPYIDDVSVEDDKITVSGVINVNIIYVTGDDENPVYSVKNSVPFSQTIEAKGAKEGMTVTIDRDISNIRFNMLSDREVEIRCVLNMETNVCKEVTGIFSVDANVTDMDKEEIRNIPSMVIYVVKEGDTLWKLSKRFNSTVDCIAEINKLENPDLIYPGQKLVIVKMPMR
jgi:LysM repeat protein